MIRPITDLATFRPRISITPVPSVHEVNIIEIISTHASTTAENIRTRKYQLVQSFSTACRYCPGLWWRIEANYKYVQVLVPLNSDQALQVAADHQLRNLFETPISSTGRTFRSLRRRNRIRCVNPLQNPYCQIRDILSNLKYSCT